MGSGRRSCERICKMIPAAILNQLLKAFIASDVGKSLIKYKDEPNDADKKCLELEQKLTDQGFEIKAIKTIYKDEIENIKAIIKDMQDE